MLYTNVGQYSEINAYKTILMYESGFNSELVFLLRTIYTEIGGLITNCS